MAAILPKRQRRRFCLGVSVTIRSWELPMGSKRWSRSLLLLVSLLLVLSGLAVAIDAMRATPAPDGTESSSPAIKDGDDEDDSSGHGSGHDDDDRDDSSGHGNGGDDHDDYDGQGDVARP